MVNTDDEFSHLIDEIIHLTKQPQDDKFLHALLWPQATINALRISSLTRKNEDLLGQYKQGIKISTGYLLVFSLVQISIFICLLKPVLDFLTVVIFLKFDQWDDFLGRNFNTQTMIGILLIFLLLYFYGRHYQKSIRLTPTFDEYIQQRIDFEDELLANIKTLLKNALAPDATPQARNLVDYVLGLNEYKPLSS